MPRDTLIQHNGFTGQAIHTEDGKAERIVRVDDWVGKYTFATESASARLELTVDRCDARTRRFATDTMVLEVVDAASTLSAQDGREQCERQGSGAGVPAASARSGSRTGDTDTTGVGVWLSSFVMIPWIRGPGATAVHGRRVLELGSGVGVAGLAAASRPLQPQTLTLSDCMPELVTLMEQNVALNRGMLSVQPVVQMLEWDSAHTDTFETILACDCVYKSTAAAFIRAVFALLSEGGELVLTNPTEKGRPGIDQVIYALKERGDVTHETVAITMEPEGYQKEIIIVHMRNYSPAQITPAETVKEHVTLDEEEVWEGPGGCGEGEHPDIFDDALVDEFAGMFEDSD